MVKIINGEIVQDDDPRLQPRHQLPTPGPRPGTAEATGPLRPSAAARNGTIRRGGGGSGGLGFSLSASPLRFVPPLPGVEPLFGLPDAEVFGVRMSLYAALAAVALGIFFGWRGAAVALVLYFVYLASQDSNPAASPQGPTQPRSGVHASQQELPTAGASQEHQHQGSNVATDWLKRYLDGPKPRSRSRAPGLGTGEDTSGASRRHAAQGVGGDDEGSGASGGGGGAGAGWTAFQGRGNKLGCK